MPRLVVVLAVLLSVGGQPHTTLAHDYRRAEMSTPDPAGAEPAGEIAYVKSGDVYLLDLQTRQERQLTREGTVLPGLRWSPDGRRLLYTKGEEGPASTWLLDLPAGRSREIPAQAAPGAFSPDARWLTFSGDGGKLWNLSLESLRVTPLTDTPHADFGPDYGADGSLYFFRGIRGGEEFTTTLIMQRLLSGEERAVFDMEVAGGLCAPNRLEVFADERVAFGTYCGTRFRAVGVLDLRSGAVTDAGEIYHGRECMYVGGWAPNRPLLAIVDSSLCDNFQDEENATQDIVVLDFDVAKPGGKILLSEQRSWDVAWSPDGDWIAGEKYDANGRPQGILVVSAQGGQPRQLTAAGGSPAWRPGARSHTFPETGHTVSGRFWEVWQGGRSFDESLYVNGFPITDKHDEVSPTDGRVYQTQWFERARFEEHPENNQPHDVLLGLLGVRAARGRAQEAPFRPVGNPGAGWRWFVETGHTLGDNSEGGKTIARFWNELGGLAQFGYPLSQPFMEQSKDDGKTYLVQYFERQRFEYHPENRGTRFEVLLGRLGSEQVAK